MINIKRFFAGLESLYQSKATEYIEVEIAELEHLFNNVAVGFMMGQAVVPLHISLELLQDIDEKSLMRSVNKAELSSHPFSYLFSIYDIA